MGAMVASRMNHDDVLVIIEPAYFTAASDSYYWAVTQFSREMPRCDYSDQAREYGSDSAVEKLPEGLGGQWGRAGN